MLREIAGRERTLTELAPRYPMSMAAVSKHLQVLERCSLIRRERQGRKQMLTLNPQTFEAAQQWLAFYQQFWSDGLDRLQTYLEKES